MKQLAHSSITFWLLQSIGWCPVFMLMLALFGDEKWNSPLAVIFATSLVLLAILTSLILRALYRIIMANRQSIFLVTLSLVVLSLAAALFVGQTYLIIAVQLSQIWPEMTALVTKQPAASISLVLTPIYFTWSCLYWLITRQLALTQAQQNNEYLSLRIKEAQLSMLLSQLNPHFMFNTINNIRSLVRLDQDRARDMLTAFADILRYQFTTESTALVTVQQEMAFVTDYIAIHQLQLGQRMRFKLDIDPSLLNQSIPKMTIQLLVENAIKHAFGKQGVSGELRLAITPLPTSAESPNQTWQIDVSHPGRIQSSEQEKKQNHDKEQGIGLTNLTQRLAMQEPEASLQLFESQGQVHCQITLPRTAHQEQTCKA